MNYRRKIQYLKNSVLAKFIHFIQHLLRKEKSEDKLQMHIDQIRSRNNLPYLLNHFNLNGEGVEIGVQNGLYSEIILSRSHLQRLYSIDPWMQFPNMTYYDEANVSQSENDLCYVKTILRLQGFRSRSVCLRMTSLDAVRLFKDQSLDFIYIDANHSYTGCKEDIKIWWPKLRIGALFAGHDYLDGVLQEGNYGVKKAVDEFASCAKQKVYFTDEEWPSWYLIRT